MHRRRTLLTLLPALALPALTLAACEDLRLPEDSPVGFGDSVRGPALEAPWAFGDLSRWNGQPGAAARAVAALEHLADALQGDPFYTPEFSPTVVLQLQAARAEVRQALGIDPGAAPPDVIATLDGTAWAMEASDRTTALATLDRAPFFTLGGQATLQRLASLPALPRAAEAAQAIAAEMMRIRR